MIKRIGIIAIVIAGLAFPLQASVQGRMAGVVKDQTGAPVSGVEITIVSMKMSSRQYKTRTDAEGKFTQIGLWPEFYQVSFKKNGYMPISSEVRVRIDETSKLEITLRTADQAVQRQLSDADKKFVRGNKLYAEGKYPEAVEIFQEAVTMSADQWAYHFNLGLAAKKAGLEDQTISAFGKAVELNPDSFSCNKEIGEALAKAQRFDEARPYYDKAYEINQDDADTNYNYGLVLLKTGDSEKALEVLRRAVSLKEDYAEAYYQLGTIYVGQNNKPEAIANLEKFLELAPDDPQAAIARQLLDYLKKQPGV